MQEFYDIHPTTRIKGAHNNVSEIVAMQQEINNRLKVIRRYCITLMIIGSLSLTLQIIMLWL